jgi:FkbM family methyltransferase
MWKEKIANEMEDILNQVQTCDFAVAAEPFRGQKVILYGAGIDGIKVFTELEKLHAKVIAFFDLRADELGHMKGIPVLKPDAEIVNASEKAAIPVLITVKPFKPTTDAITKTLLELGYANIVKATDIFDFYSFRREDLSDLDKITSSIIRCAQLLEDETSYKIYKGFISSHATKEYDSFLAPSENVKYFDSDFRPNKGYQIYVDCGAFNGDTLRDLNRIHGGVEKAALFESDMGTFQDLLKMVGGDSRLYAREMALFPCGVWSDTVKLRANNGMGLNSHISDDGDDIIQCVALDQVLKGFGPTFLKLDVEGAEYQALTGAREMITEYRPDMVISLYHNLRDIWELPLYIQDWDLGYKFYIRVYGKGGNATMLYAFADQNNF